MPSSAVRSAASWIGRTAQETPPDAAIDVWFTADPLRASGQNKIAALNAAASAFQTLYPNVELRLQSIAPDQYKQRLKQAQQDGSLPVLFERTAQSTDLACNAKALRAAEPAVRSSRLPSWRAGQRGLCRARPRTSRFVCVECVRRRHRL
ncbi:MAG: hypothetical protein ACLS3C_11730 [Oscillospiraceae bacterium]